MQDPIFESVQGRVFLAVHFAALLAHFLPVRLHGGTGMVLYRERGDVNIVQGCKECALIRCWQGCC